MLKIKKIKKETRFGAYEKAKREIESELKNVDRKFGLYQ